MSQVEDLLQGLPKGETTRRRVAEWLVGSSNADDQHRGDIHVTDEQSEDHQETPVNKSDEGISEGSEGVPRIALFMKQAGEGGARLQDPATRIDANPPQGPTAALSGSRKRTMSSPNNDSPSTSTGLSGKDPGRPKRKGQADSSKAPPPNAVKGQVSQKPRDPGVHVVQHQRGK